MATEFGTGKTVFILAIVVGCFAILWPKIFYPMLQESVSSPPVTTVNNQVVTDCCDVIFDKDVNAIKIMTELCEKILYHQEDYKSRLTFAFQQGKLTKEIINRCKNEVKTKCDVDITAFLSEKVRLGQSYKQMLDDVRSLNSSLCLKENFGVTPSALGAPRRMRIWSISSSKHLRQERPPHLRPEMLHPALREKGRAIPQSHIVPKVIEKEGRPPPIPGMRPPMGGAGHVVPAPKGGSTMGIIMPMYTVGIVIFFMYTMMKLLFKKSEESSAYKEFTSDPEFRRVVFNETDYVSTRNSRKIEEENPTKLEDIELDQLRRRLAETEAAMERIVKLVSNPQNTDILQKVPESEKNEVPESTPSSEQDMKNDSLEFGDEGSGPVLINSYNHEEKVLKTTDDNLQFISNERSFIDNENYETDTLSKLEGESDGNNYIEEKDNIPGFKHKDDFKEMCFEFEPSSEADKGSLTSQDNTITTNSIDINNVDDVSTSIEKMILKETDELLLCEPEPELNSNRNAYELYDYESDHITDDLHDNFNNEKLLSLNPEEVSNQNEIDYIEEDIVTEEVQKINYLEDAGAVKNITYSDEEEDVESKMEFKKINSLEEKYEEGVVEDDIEAIENVIHSTKEINVESEKDIDILDGDDELGEERKEDKPEDLCPDKGFDIEYEGEIESTKIVYEEKFAKQDLEYEEEDEKEEIKVDNETDEPEEDEKEETEVDNERDEPKSFNTITSFSCEENSDDLSKVKKHSDYDSNEREDKKHSNTKSNVVETEAEDAEEEEEEEDDEDEEEISSQLHKVNYELEEDTEEDKDDGVKQEEVKKDYYNNDDDEEEEEEDEDIEEEEEEAGEEKEEEEDDEDIIDRIPQDTNLGKSADPNSVQTPNELKYSLNKNNLNEESADKKVDEAEVNYEEEIEDEEEEEEDEEDDEEEEEEDEEIDDEDEEEPPQRLHQSNPQDTVTNRNSQHQR